MRAPGTVLFETLRGDFNTGAPPEIGGTADLSLWIDGADLPDGSEQPFWNGMGTFAELDADAMGGRITFADARLMGGATGEVQPAGWPTALSGSVTWGCDAWRDLSAMPPPPGSATLDLELDVPGWEPSGAAVTCTYGESGSVDGVEGEIGTLHGELVATLIMLNGDHRPGQEEIMTLTVVMGRPSADEFIPNWEGVVMVDEIAADDRSGAGPIELQFVPPAADWPMTLSGTVRWRAHGVTSWRNSPRDSSRVSSPSGSDCGTLGPFGDHLASQFVGA